MTWFGVVLDELKPVSVMSNVVNGSLQEFFKSF